MSIREITETIQAIRADYENGNITGGEMSEYLEDLVTDIKDKNDHSQIFDNDESQIQDIEDDSKLIQTKLIQPSNIFKPALQHIILHQNPNLAFSFFSGIIIFWQESICIPF